MTSQIANSVGVKRCQKTENTDGSTTTELVLLVFHGFVWNPGCPILSQKSQSWDGVAVWAKSLFGQHVMC
jgi:hypothetical protein